MVGLIARRLGEDIEARPAPLNMLLSGAADRPEVIPQQVVAGLGARSALEALVLAARRGLFRPGPR